ncbi:MAG: phytochelatin synthase family protein [Synechococcaceae cyanobacterium]|nr:phytochelatin synthase family protein [Synechococcaceae cyanobacterium]
MERPFPSGRGTALPVALALLAIVPALPGTAMPIPLPVPRGQELLRGSTARADYGPLAESFLTQANLAYCGVASAVMVLNSLSVPAPPAAGYAPYRFWTQENVFAAAAVRRWVQPRTVAQEGMTLEQLAGLLAGHGLAVERFHGENLSLAQFRRLLRRNLADPGDRLLVNYHRGALGQEGAGHIVPVGGYHAPSDRVLLLDVARYRYPSVWVPVSDLWQGIRTVDGTSGRSRGLLSVRRAAAQPPAPGSTPP